LILQVLNDLRWGLALKDLNLVPKEYLLKNRRKKKVFLYSIAGVFLASMLAVFVTEPLLTGYNLRRKFSILDKQIKESVNYVEIEREFSQLQNVYMQREDEAKALMSMGFSITSLIETIEKYMPEKLFTMNLSVNNTSTGTNVILRGVSASENELASFISHLRNSSVFDSVELTTVNRKVTNVSTSGTYDTGSSNGVKDLQVESYDFEINLIINSGK